MTGDHHSLCMSIHRITGQSLHSYVDSEGLRMMSNARPLAEKIYSIILSVWPSIRTAESR